MPPGAGKATGERHAIETFDFATAMPVKGQESKATTVDLALPNFVPMTTEDLRAWATRPEVRAWLGEDLLDGLTKKVEIVAAVKLRAAELEAGPGGDKAAPTAPEDDFEDID